MTVSVSDAINDYYKLKQEYDSKIIIQKYRIIRNFSLSRREKRQKFQQMKKYCIKCNKEGGSIFESNGTILTALCGNTQNPCELNIKINRGSFNNIRNMDKTITDDVKKLQDDIILTKLNLLFNYKNEEESISEFTELRENLSNDMKILDFTRSEFIKIVDNPEINKILKQELEHFYLERDKLSLLHKQYIETPTPAIIKDMVELHISTLYPLATKIRELKYKFSTIEINDKNISKLIQEPYTYEELFISDIDDQPEIISNVY